MKTLLMRTVALLSVACVLMLIWIYRGGVIRGTTYSLSRDGATWHRQRFTDDRPEQRGVRDWIGGLFGLGKADETISTQRAVVPVEMSPFLIIKEAVHVRSTFAAEITRIRVLDQPGHEMSGIAETGIHPNAAQLPKGDFFMMKWRPLSQKSGQGGGLRESDGRG